MTRKKYQRIAVLGFAFKADTGDTRESAAITLIRDFLQEKAIVNIYDPKVVDEQIWSDLAEALPSVPLSDSTSPLLYVYIAFLNMLYLIPSPKTGPYLIKRSRVLP